jgi:hypothetical protein
MAGALLFDRPALSYQFFDRPAFNCFNCKLQCQFAKVILNASLNHRAATAYSCFSLDIYETVKQCGVKICRTIGINVQKEFYFTTMSLQ